MLYIYDLQEMHFTSLVKTKIKVQLHLNTCIFEYTRTHASMLSIHTVRNTRLKTIVCTIKPIG